MLIKTEMEKFHTTNSAQWVILIFLCIFYFVFSIGYCRSELTSKLISRKFKLSFDQIYYQQACATYQLLILSKLNLVRTLALDLIDWACNKLADRNLSFFIESSTFFVHLSTFNGAWKSFNNTKRRKYFRKL